MDVALRFGLQPPDLRGVRALELWATHYYLPEVSPAIDGHPLLDAHGRALGPKLSLRDWCNAALQGSVRVRRPGGHDTYNYAGVDEEQVDCRSVFGAFPAIGRTRFERARGEYGDGEDDRVLVPYRSLAVDPETIAFGSVVFIPDARGTQVRLPSGETRTHDGYFLAADRGGAIKDRHVDVYIGLATKCPFAFVTSQPSGTFSAYVVDPPEAATILRRAHRPSAPPP